MFDAKTIGEELALGSLLSYLVWWDAQPVQFDALTDQEKIYLFKKNQIASNFKEYDILLEQAFFLAKILKFNGDAWEVNN